MNSNSNGFGPESAPQPMAQPASGATDFRQIYHVLLDKAWIVVGTFVVALLLTVAYLHRAPRIFAATATLQVEQQEQKILKFERVVQEDLRSSETLRTILQTIKTRSLLERVAQSNNLAYDIRYTTPSDTPPTPIQIAGGLAQLIKVSLRPGTRLIDVTVEHENPYITSQLANSLVEDFIRLGFEQDSATSELANEHLLREVERLRKKLHDSEIALQKYLEESQSISLEERQNIVTPKLKELNTRVTEAKSTRIKLEPDYDSVNHMGTYAVALLTLTSIANDPTVMGIQVNIAKMEADFATLKLRYRPEHPKYLALGSQLVEMRGSLDEAAVRARQTLISSYDSARATEKALEVALKEQEQAALVLNKQAIQYSVLSREVESDRVMYDAVLGRLKETSLTKELASYKVRIVEPALTPTYPFKPKKTSVLMRGLILGLLAGIALALGINSLDNTFKTVDQAEEVLGAPVLATLPTIKELESADNQVVVEENSNSGYAEAFRTLRASLSMLGRVEDRRVFLFTSALPQEGKTFCSVNFALSLSQQGLRTLLIDCDLRRPNVERALFGKRMAQVGVADFLTGRKTLNDVANSTNFHDFYYVGVGTHAPNPAELLAQGRFAKLLEEAVQQFDRVVIDSAPLQAVSDTLLILEGVQTVCLTVRSGKTPRKASLRALQTLRNAGAPAAGVVLNFLKRPRGGGYYYSYYDYSYGDSSKNKSRTKESTVVELPKAAGR